LATDAESFYESEFGPVIEKLFRSRWILPISQPPIENGWLMTRGLEVVALGSGDDWPHGSQVVDLGDAAILPGLVNAHTHLEFSDLARPIGFPGIKLHQWIELVIRNRTSRADPGWVISKGAALAFEGGAHLVGEIATVPWAGFRSRLSPEIVVFGEVLGLATARADERFSVVSTHFAKSLVVDRVTAAISPHAPYSTSLETVARCVDYAKSQNALLAMHMCESIEERELIERGTGPFAQQLKNLGVFQASHFGKGSKFTLAILQKLAEAPSALIIHGNDLRPSEIDFLSSQSQMTVVYCPRTHSFFQHPQHPVRQLIDSGVRVALGTDSLASNPDLSIWNEVRWLLKHRDDISWHETLAMATIHGADAFGRSDLGRIQAGARCGLIAVPGGVQNINELPGLWIAEPSQPVWLTAPADFS
jgi:cytosine/adenosine deaminase-related metal-dependent hydrolase